MVRRASCILLLLLAACLRRSPESRILAAFRETDFEKERTDSPRDSTAAKCTAITTVVREIMRENAIVAVFQDCAGPHCPSGQNCMGGNAIRFETDYLMVRSNGRWHVCRPIAGGATPVTS